MGIRTCCSFQAIRCSVLSVFYLICVLFLALPFAPSANAAVTTVTTCPAGTEIQAALDANNDVDLKATCEEDIFIRRNGTTVDSSDGTGILKGTVTIKGADRVTLKNFEVENPSGGGGGVVIIEGAHVDITDMEFDNLDDGFCVTRNSFADINGLNSTTQTSPSSSACTNVTVLTDSVVRMVNSTLVNDTDVGEIGAPMSVTRGSTVMLRGNNSITNNGTDAAISLSLGSAVRIDDAITGTTNTIVGAIGLDIFHDSTMDVRHATVTATDNFVGFDSSLRIKSANVTISGNVLALNNSRMEIDSAATINGEVGCQSFSSMNNATPSGTGSVNCPYEIQTFGASYPGFILDGGGNVYLAGTLNSSSSRTVKTGFKEIDSSEILSRIMEMPITKWSYKGEEKSMQHIGPMSEDFYSAFGLGKDNKTISTTDSSGIALAAIQGLKRQQDQKDTEISELKNEVARLNQLIEKLASENLLVVPAQ